MDPEELGAESLRKDAVVRKVLEPARGLDPELLIAKPTNPPVSG